MLSLQHFILDLNIELRYIIARLLLLASKNARFPAADLDIIIDNLLNN